MNQYTLALDYSEIHVLEFIIEVSINRQLNHIVACRRKVAKLDKQIAELRERLNSGKRKLIERDPKWKLEKIETEKKQINSLKREAELDLFQCRRIYDRIVTEREKDELYIRNIRYDEYMNEDRDEIVIYGPYKEYFKIEHFIN